MTTYGWGNNNHGCLGIGNVNVNGIVSTPTALSLDFVEAVSADGVCTLFRTWDGLVYWAGSNTYSVDPGVSTTVENHTPTLHSHSFTNPIIRLSMGSQGSSYLALDNQFQLWAWGTQTYGQFGQGNTTTFTTPTVIATDVIDFSGDNTIVVLRIVSGAQVLQAAGHNDKGACANGNTTDQHTWVTFSRPTGHGAALWVAEAEASDQTIFVGMSDGTIWGAGSSAEGQLGFGTTGTPNTAAHSTLVQITFPTTSTVDLDTSAHSAYGAVLVDYADHRTVYGIGYDANNELGVVGATTPFTPTATQVDLTNLPTGVFLNKKPKGYPHQTNNCWIGTDGKPYVMGPMANPAGPTYAGNLQASTGLTSMQWVSSGSNVSGGGSLWAGVEPTVPCASNSGTITALSGGGVNAPMFGVSGAGTSSVAWPSLAPIVFVGTITVSVTSPANFNEVAIQAFDTTLTNLSWRQFEYVDPGAPTEPHITSHTSTVIISLPAINTNGNAMGGMQISVQFFSGTVSWVGNLY